MKTKDIIRYDNKLFQVLEILPNGNIGAMRLEDEEKHVLKPNEVVLVQKYQSDIKDVTKSLYEFFNWMFSDECDKWIKVRFFLFVKIAFLFCAAFTVFMIFYKLSELL
ncbi:hypothetical protein CCP3SC1AL1_1620001 [Gammaproteobacteria bacterium]